MPRLNDWVLDYAYWIKGIAAFRRKPPSHYRHNKNAEKVPVILLSGLSLKWHFLRHLGDRISLAGHPVFVIPNLRGNWISVAQAADFVREVIDEHNLQRIVIVAHSKGGIIAKYLLVNHNYDKRVKLVIAVASPFSGTRLARIIPHRALYEMLPDSSVLQELQENTAVNKQIVSIIPEFDNHVWAEQGSYLDGAKNINVKVRGHHRVIFDKSVENIIMETIKKASDGSSLRS